MSMGIKAGITSEKLIYESHFIVRIAPETRKMSLLLQIHRGVTEITIESI